MFLRKIANRKNKQTDGQVEQGEAIGPPAEKETLKKCALHHKPFNQSQSSKIKTISIANQDCIWKAKSLCVVTAGGNHHEEQD